MGAADQKGIPFQSLMPTKLHRTSFICAAVLTLGLVGPSVAQDTPSFAKDIAPLLAANCVACHAGNAKMGELGLETFEDLERGGAHGKAVIPGDSEGSRLYRMVSGKLEPSMPLGGGKLPAQQIDLIKRWIDAGAVGPGPGETASVKQAPVEQKKIEPTSPVNAQIFSLAYRPDGRALALGGFQVVRLASASTGKTQTTFEGMQEVVRSVAFSPDGRLLAAAGGLPARGGEVKIWDVASSELLRTIQGHADTIYATVFSPDGSILATSSYDRLIKLWDVDSGAELRTLKDHIDAVYALAFTPDGKWLLSGAADRSLKIWNVSSGERLYTVSDPLEGINAITIHPSGKRVAAGGLDRTIRIWELGEKEGTLLRSLIAHEGPILQIAFSPDGEKLVTASTDGTIKVFRSDDLTELKILSPQPDWVMSLRFSPDGSRFAAGRFDGSLSIYDLDGYKDQLDTLRASR